MDIISLSDALSKVYLSSKIESGDSQSQQIFNVKIQKWGY